MTGLPRVLALLVLVATIAPSPALRAAASEPQRAPEGRTVLGYYVPYDPGSWISLRDNAASIDIVAAQWVTIDACGNLMSRDDQTLKQFARENGIRVFPSLLTMSAWLNSRVLNDDAVAAHAIARIVEYVEAEGYEGFDLDLEAVDPGDRPAYTAFVAALATALHERGKELALALPAKTRDTTAGWGGAFDYAALGVHADLVTIMAYEFSGAWGGPGSIGPYDWVDQVAAYATSAMPAHKVLLGLGFYGYDWNTTWGGARALSHGQASRLAERYQVGIELDPASRSATFRYQAPAGDPPPAALPVPPLQHQITTRAAPPCPVATPEPAPRPAPRPISPEDIQDHEVWLENSASAAARLTLADRHTVGGIATWRLGQEDTGVWEVFHQWRSGR